MFPQFSEAPKPAVWNWYAAYCVAMALLYLFLVIFGFIFLFIEPDQNMDPMEAKIMGAVFIGIGLVLLVPYAAGPLLPRERWAWIVGVVLIGIGMTSLCCLPVAIPLLLGWLKPETKAYYNAGRD